jgi:hypothetical protein
MHRIDTFSLVPRTGAAADSSELWLGARKLADKIPGTSLEAQFALGSAGRAPFLLLTSHDVPYEEMIHVLLIDESGELIEQAELGGPYAPGLLANVQIVSEDTLSFDFQGPVRLTVHPAPRGWLRRRRLSLSRSPHPKGVS